jgi:uncharacterized membrane protein
MRAIQTNNGPRKEIEMGILAIGLCIFLDVHSIRIAADSWRSAQIARFGEKIAGRIWPGVDHWVCADSLWLWHRAASGHALDAGAACSI